MLQFNGGAVALCVAALAAPGLAQAVAPAGVTFQGLALDPAGSPLQGPQSLTLRIWDDPSSTAPGDLMFQETHASVSFVDGAFSVVIGTGSLPGGSFQFGHDLFENPDLWLEIAVAGEVLAPRTKLQSVAYALQCANADTLSGFAPGSLVQTVGAGPGLGGGGGPAGGSGTVTLFVDFTQTQQRVSGACPEGSSIRQIEADGTVVCQPDTSNAGDITSVTAGRGLTGGGTTGNVVVAIALDGIDSSMIAPDVIVAADVGADAIGSSELAPNAVTTLEIAPDTILAGDIAANAITSSELASNAVTSAKVLDGSLTGADLADSTVTADDVADGSLQAADILDETGVEFDGTQSFHIFSQPFVSTILSVTLNAPSSGYAVVNASGSFSSGPPDQDSMRCSITTGTTTDAHEITYLGDPAAFQTVPFGSTRGFTVSAGPNVFRLVCQLHSGSVSVNKPDLTAIFAPTRY